MSITNRNATWAKLQQSPHYDLVIVGGGITGAGALLEATRAGLKAVLIEQQDYAWGTSSRSSKMVHGGLRYIAQGDLRLTRHSVQEREKLINELPGLVDRMGYVFLLRKGQFPGKFLFRLLLALYESFAGVKTRDFWSTAKIAAAMPNLNSQQLDGGCYYTDAATDDARLVLRVLQEACDNGADAGNYLKADTLLKNDAGTVIGVQVTNTITDETATVTCDAVVNATGAWADTLRELAPDQRNIRPLRGSHIVLPRTKISVDDALTIFHPHDKRAVFIFPWENQTVVGTTDLDHPESLDIEPTITQQEVDYLLAVANAEFPTSNVNNDDILSSWAGVRPIISSGKGLDPSKEKRNHSVWVDPGLITVSGGKLTTFRLIALDALDATKAFLKKSVTFARNNPRIFASTTIGDSWENCPPSLQTRLMGRYGNTAEALWAQATESEQQPIENTHYTLAEMTWAMQSESVEHLDDLMLRRTHLGFLLPLGGWDWLNTRKSYFQARLHWSDSRWESELERYRTLWLTCYSTPAQSASMHSKVNP